MVEQKSSAEGSEYNPFQTRVEENPILPSSENPNSPLGPAWILRKVLTEYFHSKEALKDFPHPNIEEEVTKLYEMTSFTLDSTILERETNIFRNRVHFSYTEIINELVGQVEDFLRNMSPSEEPEVQKRVDKVSKQTVKVADMISRITKIEGQKSHDEIIDKSVSQVKEYLRLMSSFFEPKIQGSQATKIEKQPILPSNENPNSSLGPAWILRKVLTEYFHSKEALKDFPHPNIEEEVTKLYEMTSFTLAPTKLERRTNSDYTKIVDQVEKYLYDMSLSKNPEVQKKVDEVSKKIIKLADMTIKIIEIEKRKSPDEIVHEMVGQVKEYLREMTTSKNSNFQKRLNKLGKQMIEVANVTIENGKSSAEIIDEMVGGVEEFLREPNFKNRLGELKKKMFKMAKTTRKNLWGKRFQKEARTGERSKP